MQYSGKAGQTEPVIVEEAQTIVTPAPCRLSILMQFLQMDLWYPANDIAWFYALQTTFKSRFGHLKALRFTLAQMLDVEVQVAAMCLYRLIKVRIEQ